MRIAVTPDANGIISAGFDILGTRLHDAAVVIELDSLIIPANSVARLDGGQVEIVADWRGSGPWFDQDAALADRETPIHINEYGVDPTTKNWAMMPRPLTKAEIKAAAEAEAESNAKAEAEAKAKAAADEKEWLANLAVPLFSLRKVFRDTKAADGASYLSKVDQARTAGALSEDAFEAITMLDPVRRSSPYVAEFQTTFGFTDDEVTALFIAAKQVPV